MRVLVFLFIFSIILLTSCSKAVSKPSQTNTDTISQNSFPKATYDITKLNDCTLFNSIPNIVNMARQDYKEISGVAPSHINKGVLYVHEDSGNANDIYLTDSTGADLGKVVLDGIFNRDWEDIATGPGPVPGKSYIYIADIGDNDLKYSTKYIYRFEEPALNTIAASTEIHIYQVDKIEVKLSEGIANAETLVINPSTKDLFLFTKERGSSLCYAIPYPQSVASVITIKPIVKLPFDLLTGGDISADGNALILRDKGQIWYWSISDGATLQSTLLSKPQNAPYAGNEPQGEGVCFSVNNTGYFTNTEIKKYPNAISTLSFYKKL
ncbi:hypothetical protein [Arachidicoccus soli]|uniref:PE-PGRS family protein n=1 Tax=Arachidicoccus soli TaxID=2341117 RepID=A0A386HN03_9BACT|nr:hypothetical protein [Arachidicoccus soli]AYD47052.1 hypothetical protein D6B99_05155 [Arachidicoccus soli]